jgi:hypothetical protein
MSEMSDCDPATGTVTLKDCDSGSGWEGRSQLSINKLNPFQKSSMIFINDNDDDDDDELCEFGVHQHHVNKSCCLSKFGMYVNLL